jgi:hypothetical protein
MDLLTLLVAISSLAGVFALKLAMSELQDWMPWVASRIIDHAVAQLPEPHRRGYREEWARTPK